MWLLIFLEFYKSFSRLWDCRRETPKLWFLRVEVITVGLMGDLRMYNCFDLQEVIYNFFLILLPMLSDPYELERFKNSQTSLARAQFKELYSEE